MQHSNRQWILFTLVLFLLTHTLNAVPRSTGIGFRGTLFKSNQKESGFRIMANAADGSAAIETPGGGANFFLFSRLTGNWVLETSIGVMGDAEIVVTDNDNTQVKSSGLAAFLFGVRYDLLPPGFANSFHPYLSGGPGYYMIHESNVSTSGFSAEIGGKLKSKYGFYAGGGLFILLTDWFGLNLDGRYHQVGKVDGIDRGGAEFGFGLAFMWGRKNEIFEIVNTQIIVKDIYPAYYQFYNTYPIAMVTVRNRASSPIEVNIKSEIPGISERKAESGFVRLGPRETKDIPVHVQFGSRLLETTSREPATIDLKIEARAGTILSKTISAQITVHSRNGWNGDIDKLNFFIHPEADLVREFARAAVVEDTSKTDPHFKNFHAAGLVFEALQRKNIRYLSDPNVPFYRDDNVQFAESTLELGTGDCDDLTVLMASLLESLGIHTAFVDVRDPDKDTAHLYLLFDSGLTPEEAGLVTSNSKRYIIRSNESGRTICWIPLETTLIQHGFEEAWKTGALEYLQDAEIRSGLLNGWVRIFDVR